MLPPDHRQLLLELLRPEPGYTLHSALGTTFALDLHSLLQVPVAFLHQAGLLRQESGELDPLTILESLRRFADKLTIFTQAGYIKLPLNIPRLAALLEPCVCQVRSPIEGGLFHPKIWVLRFQSNAPDEGSSIRYRFLCLSRNLTFDRSWDTVVSLDGVLREDLTRAVKRENHALADFVAALPNLPLASLSPDRRQGVERMADELRRVEFDVPEGFEGYDFHHAGLSSSKKVFPPLNGRVLIVSPFVTAGFIDRFTSGSKVTLVSRLEELDQVARASLAKCERVFVLNRQAGADDKDQGEDLSTELDGLHAKIFIVDQGKDASVLTGSFNATNAAFERNVEFMIELKGKRSAHGVSTLVPFAVEEVDRAARGQCFGDLLDPYNIDAPVDMANDDEEAWEQACASTRNAVIEAYFQVHISPNGDLFDFSLKASNPFAVAEEYSLWAWPVTVSRSYAQDLSSTNQIVSFSGLSFSAITAWIAFEFRQGPGEGSRRKAWVMKLDLLGVPADRNERLLASLLQTREELLRFLLLMLRLDDQAPAEHLLDDFSWLWKQNDKTPVKEMAPPLLETLLRAAHRSPKTLHRIAALMSDLRKTQEGAALEDEDLRRLWEPIWETVK